MLRKYHLSAAVLVCVLLSTVANAQLLTGLNFATHPIGDQTVIRETRTDAAGNSFELVQFDGTVFVGNDTFVAQSVLDYLIVKRDQNEVYQWARRITCSFSFNCNSLDADDSGNVYVIGSYGGQDTLRFDLGNNSVYEPPYTNYYNGYIGKYDGDGNLQWVKILEGQYSSAYPTQISFDYIRVHGNSFFVCSVNYGSADYDPSSGIHILNSGSGGDNAIADFTLDGDLKWVNLLECGGRLRYVQFTSTDETVIAGTAYGSQVDLAPGPQSQTFSVIGGRDLFMLKLDTNGMYVWGRTIISSGVQHVTGLALMNDSCLIISGDTDDDVDLDPSLSGSSIIYCSSGERRFLARYDMSGADFISAQEIYIVRPEEIFWNGNNQIVAVGGVYSAGQYAIGIYDSNLVQVSVETYSGSSSSVQPWGSHLSNQNALYVFGHAAGNIFYGNDGMQDVYYFTTANTGFVARYFMGWGPQSVSENIALADRMLLYPNPASDAINVQITGEHSLPTMLSVFDMLGNEVLRREDLNLSGGPVSVSTSMLPNGSYLLVCNNAEGVYNSPLIISR